MGLLYYFYVAFGTKVLYNKDSKGNWGFVNLLLQTLIY